MSNAFSSAGTTVGLSATLPGAFDAAGYGALTFTEIGEIESVPEFGPSFSLITFTPLNSRVVSKRKGSVNYGQLAITLGRVPSDAGQTILIAAQASDASQAIEITLQDGTKIYTTGQVMSYRTNVGNTESMTLASVMIELDRPLIEVAP
ncbi:MAG: phage tail tube protein [Pseudomonadota bacterium]